MSDAIYDRLAEVLNTLPNGFPRTESGVEIKLLKKMFEPDEAELFCELKLNFENVEQIAKRTGRPAADLEKKLDAMWRRGLAFGVSLGGMRIYKMMPWVFGLYEFQIDRMDREFVELCEAYMPYFGAQFFRHEPALMRTIPIEEKLTDSQEALSYDRVSAIIENGRDFAVNDCICKKEQRMMDRGCDKPLEVCLAVAPVAGVFDDHPWGRKISKAEAYAVLRKAEEGGLVHLSRNVVNGQDFICNCCGCCCGVLRSINEFKIDPSLLIKSNYFARIDQDLCTQCGVCADERCQVKAVVEEDGAYRVIESQCIGCGLCVTTCPTDAVTLVAKQPSARELPPENEDQWFEKRAQARGVDYSRYVK
jgi:Fe-S-cluster-containing hydrogenase component 2